MALSSHPKCADPHFPEENNRLVAVLSHCPPNGGPNGLAKTIKIAFVLLQKYGAIFAPRLRRSLFLQREKKERDVTLVAVHLRRA